MQEAALPAPAAHVAAQPFHAHRNIRRASYAPGRLAPGLRIVSHNVRGMGSEVKALAGTDGGPGHLHALSDCWAGLRAHIICLQETHLRRNARSGETGCAADVERRLQAAATASQRSGYAAFWAHNSFGASGGVGILISQDLITQGALKVREAGLQASADGRLLAVPVVWQGHELIIMSVYMPASNRAVQRTFIADILTPFLQRLPAAAQLIMAGDYNVTLNQALERFHLQRHNLPAVAHPHDASELSVAAALQQLCTTTGVVDAFRYKHPTSRVYTWSAPTRGCASLIDRIFVSTGLLPYLHQCSVEPSTPSDHRPMVMHLRPARNTHRPGPGVRRCRTDFQKCPILLQQFLGWATAQVAAAPATDAALIAWWPGFKEALARQLQTLSRQRTQQLRTTALPLQQAIAAAHAAADAFAQPPLGETAADMQAALQTALQADRACQAAYRPSALTAAQRTRHTWLHSSERASPLITSLTSPPAASRGIAALQATQGGGLITAPVAIASEAARFFSAVSRQPDCCPQARAAVLGAVRAHATPFTPEEETAVAARIVSSEEVKIASKHQRPGSAPGPDGIPPGVWRLADPAERLLPPQNRSGGVLRPLLARLFTAIGRTGLSPAGFLDGAVVILFKKGDISLLANYRPITLLNTDHRLLAKVLANRLAPVLARVIGQEQSGFLPGRHIGDRILFLQLLSAALSSQRGQGGEWPDSAAVVFLDFAKAFDTLDREYILDMLRTVGAGDLVHWVRLLLTGTHAVVVVNGVVSAPASWEAGVRQGCPLAPLLYVVGAWGLACHLKASPGVGVELPGCGRQHLGQVADDTQAMVTSARPEDVQPLVTAMQIYRDATGQAINPDKCEILQIGTALPVGVPGSPGSTVCGMPVVTAATALGMIFSNNNGQAPAEPCPQAAPAQPAQQTQGADWSGLLAKCRKSMAKVARMGLSVFGRASAVSSYCLSKMLYHLEFADAPGFVHTELDVMAKGLVDRRQAPGLVGGGMPDGPPAGPTQARNRNLPGIHSALLTGQPRDGGFGLLSSSHHTLARHAVWALKLINHLTPPPTPAQAEQVPGPIPPPWVALASSVLTHTCPGLHPSMAMLACASQLRHLPAGATPPMVTTPLPGPLQRMVVALSSLGPLVRITAAEPNPGPWCAHAPLWGNPHFNFEVGDVGPEWQAYTHLVGQLPRVPSLLTLRDLFSLKMRLRCQRRHPTVPDEWLPWQSAIQADYAPKIWGTATTTHERVQELMNSPQVLVITTARLYANIPLSWHTAAVNAGMHIRPPGAEGQEAAPADMVALAAHTVLEGWGWMPCDSVGDLAPARAVSVLGGSQRVRDVTSILLTPVVKQRVVRHRQYAVAAAAPAAWWANGHDGQAPATPMQHTSVELEGRQLQFTACLPALWAVPLDNRHKDAFWRLTVQGIPGAGGHDICLMGPCPCGWCVDALVCNSAEHKRSLGAPAMQAHTFWSCPVAQAVVRAISQALPANTQLHRMHIWLVIPPCTTVVLAVWQVVCMAAIAAMERGRRIFWAVHLSHLQAPAAAGQGRQQTLEEAWGFDPGPSQIQGAALQPFDAGLYAARAAVADFWSRLDDFVTVLPDCGRAWRGSAGINITHPFICADGGMPARFRINLPVLAGAAGPVVVQPAADAQV